MTGGLLWTSSDHRHGVLTGLHDLRFLPFYRTLLDRAAKAGKLDLIGGIGSHRQSPCWEGQSWRSGAFADRPHATPLYTRNTLMASSPRWLITLTAIRPEAGLENGRETLRRRVAQAS